jgi:2-polyprenyl-6-hydroxyphenyl methylase / 3-demethylubiquinone-9 3-methyltransferase
MSSTIRAEEAAHFGRLAADWWDPKGSSAMLHRLNPVRLRYIREQLNQHWDLDEHERRPLAGKSAADVGCGAGLLCEPLARLGAEVVGIDAAPENIAAARLHAEGQGLAIDYRTGSIDVLGAEPFDLITSLEVVEHVDNPAAFVRCLADALAPGGLMILSTPNRTPVSRLAMITLGEGLGAIPRGTHDWNRFLTPDELRGHVEAAGLEVLDVTGLRFSPSRGFVMGEDLALNYLLVAHKQWSG